MVRILIWINNKALLQYLSTETVTGEARTLAGIFIRQS